MSRVINIKGKLFIENRKIAIEVIQRCRNSIYFENNQFLFEKYDAYDNIDEDEKIRQMEEVEQEYLKKYNIYLKVQQQKKEEIERLKIESQKKAIKEEIDRLEKEEEKRKIAEEKERQRIKEEKQILREEKADLIIANAKKQGYKLKKEIREDNTIKLVLQKRVY